jgi:hypothetical protein
MRLRALAHEEHRRSRELVVLAKGAHLIDMDTLLLSRGCEPHVRLGRTTCRLERCRLPLRRRRRDRRVRSLDDAAASAWAGTLVDRLRREAESLPEVRVLGPAPAPIARLRDRFRYHVQAMGRDEAQLHDLVRRATATLQTPDKVAWIVDVDPVEML